MPIETAEGIRVPAIGDNYALTNDLRLMAETINGITAVTNEAARTALVAALTAAGRTPTVSDPLVIIRDDAPDGAKVEFTQNGSVWRSLPSASPWIPLTLAAGWAVVTGSRVPAVRAHGDTVQLRSGRVRWGSGTAAVAAGVVLTPVTGIPTALRPAIAEWGVGSHFLNTTVPGSCTVTISGASILITPSAGGTIGSTDPSQIIIPDMRWDRV